MASPCLPAGPVVRYAPNEVSFNTSSSLRDIYGFRKGHKKFLKSPFYDQGKFLGEASSIITERDPDRHAVWRKQLSTAFSERSMRDVEHVVSTTVDKLVGRLRDTIGGPAGVDIDPLFNMVTFDIIGHMALGVEFGCLTNGRLHDWAVFLNAGVRMMSVRDTMLKFPWLGKIACWLLSDRISKMLQQQHKHEQFTVDVVDE